MPGSGARGCWGGSYVSPIYGSAMTPTDPGSGGGGAAGGGAIMLEISDTLTVNGAITANGADGSSGGSGGSVYIITKNLLGDGAIRANGGDANTTVQYNCDGGGGGDGRIAVHYGTSTFTGNAQVVSGAAGPEGGTGGEDGTIGLFDSLNGATTR